jgi:hypothetical protein
MLNDTIDGERSATAEHNVERNLTRHSTEARVSWHFIREDWMLGSLCARSVNSGVGRFSMKSDSLVIGVV